MSSGPELASKVIKRWFHRRRPEPPRAVRIVLQLNGKTLIDISSRLALAMIDCEYGKPVEMVFDVEPEGIRSQTRAPGSGTEVKITMSEVEL